MPGVILGDPPGPVQLLQPVPHPFHMPGHRRILAQRRDHLTAAHRRPRSASTTSTESVNASALATGSHRAAIAGRHHRDSRIRHPPTRRPPHEPSPPGPTPAGHTTNKPPTPVDLRPGKPIRLSPAGRPPAQPKSRSTSPTSTPPHSSTPADHQSAQRDRTTHRHATPLQLTQEENAPEGKGGQMAEVDALAWAEHREPQAGVVGPPACLCFVELSVDRPPSQRWCIAVRQRLISGRADPVLA